MTFPAAALALLAETVTAPEEADTASPRVAINVIDEQSVGFLVMQSQQGTHFDLRGRLHWSIVDTAPRHIELAAQLADRDDNALGMQSLTDRLDHDSFSPSRDANFFRARNSSIALP
jgi:hypothetical protein